MACGNENDKFSARRNPDEPSALHRASAAFTADLSLEQLPRFPCGPDKRPLVTGGFKVATTDPAQIGVWQAQFPNCLWGVPTGAVSGIDVLDIDPEGLGWFEANRHLIPVTRVRIVSSCVGSNSASASLVLRSSRRARILRFADIVGAAHICLSPPTCA